MNAFISSKLYKVFAIFAILVSILSFSISTIYFLTKRFRTKKTSKTAENWDDLNSEILAEKLLSKDKEISDLQIKLELKKAFELELIKTIYKIESTENYDSKLLFNDLKIKIQNLNRIDEKHLTKRTNVLDNNSLFQYELEQIHPELNYQERVLCNYFRLNLSSKEIAVIEGMTDGTVRVYKNKIKNKLALRSEESLAEYLCNLSENKNSK